MGKEKYKFIQDMGIGSNERGRKTGFMAVILLVSNSASVVS